MAVCVYGQNPTLPDPNRGLTVVRGKIGVNTNSSSSGSILSIVNGVVALRTAASLGLVGGANDYASTNSITQNWRADGTNNFGIITFLKLSVGNATITSTVLDGFIVSNGTLDVTMAFPAAWTNGFLRSVLLANFDTTGATNKVLTANGAGLPPTWNTATGGSTLTVEELDGAPSVVADTLKFPNGTVTDNGGGSATYTPTAGNLPSAPTKQFTSLGWDTNSGAAYWKDDASWRRFQSLLTKVEKTLWATQDQADLIPVLSWTNIAPRTSTIPSAVVFDATNNATTPFCLLWGNVMTNLGSGASTAFLKGALPRSSSGGSFLLRLSTANRTNELQFQAPANGTCGLELFVNGQSLGAPGTTNMTASTNTSVKLIFPSFRNRNIDVFVSGYGAAAGFGHAFCNAGDMFYPPIVRNDGVIFTLTDSGAGGFGNGGEFGVTNSAGGFLGLVMLALDTEFIYDTKSGTGYATGASSNDRFIDRLTNDIPYLATITGVGQSGPKNLKAILVCGGGTDNATNTATLFPIITNFWTIASTQYSALGRFAHAYWDYTPGGNTPNYDTNLIAACAQVGVPLSSINNRITSSMLSSVFYLWSGGSWASHPTSNGHKLLAYLFIMDAMTRTNFWTYLGP